MEREEGRGRKREAQLTAGGREAAIDKRRVKDTRWDGAAVKQRSPCPTVLHGFKELDVTGGLRGSVNTHVMIRENLNVNSDLVREEGWCGGAGVWRAGVFVHFWVDQGVVPHLSQDLSWR